MMETSRLNSRNVDLLYTIKKITRSVFPPFILTLAKTLQRKLRKNNPKWQVIKNGELKGFKIYVPDSLDFFREMINGEYDSFFWDYIKNLRLEDKAVLDIGGHIGISALGFAKKIGTNGKVYVFEPNPFNLERMQMIFSENREVEKKIVILPYAVSNVNGELRFYFSRNVDDSTSSGGFIENRYTHLPKYVYRQVGFISKNVITRRLDDLIEEKKIAEIALIKIDVEGAEHFVLEGAVRTLELYKPTLLLEIHSVTSMFYVARVLERCNYRFKMLKEDTVSRCFIAASSVDS